MLKSSTTMKVSIDSLTFKTIIGILPFERIKKQKVILDIDFEYTFNTKNEKFIDYSHVSNTIKKTMKKKQFKLIEHAIIFLEKKLYKKYNLLSLKIKITKPNILADCKVSVSN